MAKKHRRRIHPPVPRGLRTRSQVVKALDTAFSYWVRLSGADDFGQVRCYTCRKRKHWKEVDAGHFQSRAKYSTRWDPMNVRPQCKHCNMTNGGQQYQFALELDREHGEGTAQDVLRRSNKMTQFTLPELRQMLAHYRAEVKKMQDGI